MWLQLARDLYRELIIPVVKTEKLLGPCRTSLNRHSFRVLPGLGPRFSPVKVNSTSRDIELSRIRRGIGHHHRQFVLDDLKRCVPFELNSCVLVVVATQDRDQLDGVPFQPCAYLMWSGYSRPFPWSD